ncbi:hypothetical protein FEM48_Zijuj12G0206200 [Ziziphus jujuba var. spinosa]|uniref:Uncharacterized protein n=1 Tax=Ziziphus jujuba var. spinosa TaxID=714518 RepID=A0A978UFF0_ZIZJJ|nr:hypothetical protein FEM48_Zijuj12G0206200 [Ziziphus jujuba var. spinosa]
MQFSKSENSRGRENDLFWEDHELAFLIPKEEQTHVCLSDLSSDGALLKARKESVDGILTVKKRFFVFFELRPFSVILPTQKKHFGYFSYEHFYVIYCKFWELDTDHDFLIDKENLIRYGNHALTYRIVERIFSQENPRSLEMADWSGATPKPVETNPVSIVVRDKVMKNLKTHASLETRATPGQPWRMTKMRQNPLTLMLWIVMMLPDSYVKEETEYSKEADKESFMDVLAALINQEYQDRLVLMMNPHPKIQTIVQTFPRISLTLACCDYKHISANCDKYRWFKSFQSLILQCAA